MKRRADRRGASFSCAARAGTPAGFGDTMVRADRYGMADEGHRNDATPQDVRAVLRELSANQRETDRHMLDTERQMQEAARRLRQTEELFVTQWDKLIEALAKRDLIVLLNRRGIQVDHVSTNLERNYRGRRWDIDILSVNSDELVAVQVRTTLNVYDVDDFLDTLRHIDELMPEYAARVAYGLPTSNESADGRGTTGSVRDSGDRQQREHHQRRTSGRARHPRF